MPVATTFRRTHLIDTLHPSYAGDVGLGINPKLLARIKASDLIVLIGGRLGEIPSQAYSLLDIPGPRQTFVHVHPGAEELGRVYHPHLAIHAAPTGFAAALEGLQPPNEISWRAQTKAAHDDYLAWTEKATPQPGGVNLGEIVVWLRQNLPEDAFITTGAGNFSAWVHRFYRFRKFATHIGPTSGSMGYGVPSALGIKRAFPERTVVCFSGDGDFLMNGQEFATAVQYDLPIIVVIADNGTYGTIRMHQEREYPTRVVGTELRNPDFAAYAKAFGGFGVTVEKTADFAAAFKAAEKSGKPAIIHLKVDTNASTPATTLEAIRAKSLAGDLENSILFLKPCRPARQRPRGEPRAAGRQHHRTLPDDDRDQCQGPGAAQGGRSRDFAAVIFDPATPSHGPGLTAVKVAASALALQVQSVPVRSATEYDSAFSAIVGERADAVLVLSTPLFIAGAKQLAALCLQHKLPSLYGPKNHVTAGGLMSYSPDRADLWRRGAIYVDKILRGVAPADLPVQQPTKFELVVNLKTAKAIGLGDPARLSGARRRGDRVATHCTVMPRSCTTLPQVSRSDLIWAA